MFLMELGYEKVECLFVEWGLIGEGESLYVL